MMKEEFMRQSIQYRNTVSFVYKICAGIMVKIMDVRLIAGRRKR